MKFAIKKILVVHVSVLNTCTDQSAENEKRQQRVKDLHADQLCLSVINFDIRRGISSVRVIIIIYVTHNVSLYRIRVLLWLQISINEGRLISALTAQYFIQDCVLHANYQSPQSSLLWTSSELNFGNQFRWERHAVELNLNQGAQNLSYLCIFISIIVLVSFTFSWTSQWSYISSIHSSVSKRWKIVIW